MTGKVHDDGWITWTGKTLLGVWVGPKVSLVPLSKRSCSAIFARLNVGLAAWSPPEAGGRNRFASDGLSYLAYYTMEKQADGTWRISGCYLVRAEDESV